MRAWLCVTGREEDWLADPFHRNGSRDLLSAVRRRTAVSCVAGSGFGKGYYRPFLGLSAQGRALLYGGSDVVVRT